MEFSIKSETDQYMSYDVTRLQLTMVSLLTNQLYLARLRVECTHFTLISNINNITALHIINNSVFNTSGVKSEKMI